MTIATTSVQTSGSLGNSSNTVFSFAFPIDDYGSVEAEDQIQVILETVATRAETILTRTTHYTVSVNGDQTASPGGSITTVATYSSAYRIWIRSSPSFLQSTDYQNQGGFLMETVEDQADQHSRQMLWLKDAVRRAPRVGVQAGAAFDGEITGDLTAGYIPQINAGGTGYTLVANNGSSNLITATGTTTARTAADRAADDRMRPEDFGAVGDGVADDTAGIQAALTAALAVHAAGGRVHLYLGPGKWRTTTAFAIDQANFTVICDGQIEQLTYPSEIFRIVGVDDCSVFIRKAINSQTKTSLSTAISTRRFAEVLRTSHAPVVVNNANRTRVHVVHSSGFINATAAFIGRKRYQFSYNGGSPSSTSIPLPTTDVDGNSMTGFADDYFNGWRFECLDDGAGAGSNIVLVTDYVTSTRTLTVPNLTVTGAAKIVSGITRSGATATATSTAHGYSNGDVVYIQGAAQSEYNIQVAVSNVAANTFDYAVSGTPATPATLASGYVSLQVAKVITPSATHRFRLIEDGEDEDNHAIINYASGHDFGGVSLAQHRNIVHVVSDAFAASQGVTPHGGWYFSGDDNSMNYLNNHVEFTGYAEDGAGEAVKVRAKSFKVDVTAVRCRGTAALEKADLGYARVRGVDIGEVAGVTDTIAVGVSSTDCQNVDIEGEVMISGNYSQAGQPGYGASIDADVRTVKGVNIDKLRIVSKSNSAGGVRALYTGHNSSAHPQALLEYVNFNEPDIEQVGTGAVIGFYAAKGDRVRFIKPRTRGLTGNLYTIASGVTNTHIQLNEELLHSGWARTNSGTSTGLAFEPRPQVSWTPVLAGTGGSANTYSTQTGFMRDLGGGLAWVHFRIILTALNSTGNLKITGFPRTFSSTYYGQLLASFEIDNMTSTIDYQVVGQGSSGTSDIALRRRSSTSGGSAAFAAGDASATLDMVMSGVVMIGDVATA